MVNPIDIAFAILKMPYHGTSLTNAQKIMEEGLKPVESEYSLYHDIPPVSFSAEDYEEALEHANWTHGTETPAIIHIPDEVEPFETHGWMHTYDKTIPPDQLSIHWQGEPYNPEQHGDESAWRKLNEELAMQKLPANLFHTSTSNDNA